MYIVYINIYLTYSIYMHSVHMSHGHCKLKATTSISQYSACMKNKTAVQIIITVCMKNKTAVKDNESLFMDLQLGQNDSLSGGIL